MVGDGQQMGQVQDLIKDYHLTDRISLTGWISPDQVKKKLVESHIFFMPSLREGMPMAGLQGLASGLAMVLSRIGSCPDLVEEGKNGFLINPGDQEGYCNALERLLTNPSLLKKCQHRSRELAEKFNLNHSISAYDQLYCQVIGHQKV